MLGHFPTLYEDELLYSGIARYHQTSGNKSQKQTIRDLFDNALVCATVDLPSHLGSLERKLDGTYTANKLIENNTLLPYYSFFLNNEKRSQIKKLMINGSSTGIVHGMLGLMAGSIKLPQYLKYCPGCIQEELMHSEPYWHRAHQIPGVVVCHKHNEVLIESNIDYSTRNHKYEYVALSQLTNELYQQKIINSDWSNHLQYIAEQSARVLFNQEGDVSNQYIKLLSQKGYLTPSNRIRFEKLISDFRSAYSDELLQYIHCSIDEDSDDTWFHKLLRGEIEITQPLRHFLLWRFFDQARSSSQLSELPFGKGPWPCLNSTAEHYKSTIIDNCIVTRCSSTGKPVGTFNCSCGFVYSRRGTDSDVEDRYKVGRIKEFGAVWYTKLSELNEGDMSSRAKARILGVDTGTVKNQSQILMKLPQLEDKKTVAKIIIIKVKKERSHRSSIRTTDWNQRDDLLVQEVNDAINKIRSFNKPVRITAASISRLILAQDLSLKMRSSLRKLPKTKTLILESTESIEAYQIRRLVWAVNKLRGNKELNIGWKALKIAGLKHPLMQSVQGKYDQLVH